MTMRPWEWGNTTSQQWSIVNWLFDPNKWVLTVRWEAFKLSELWVQVPEWLTWPVTVELQTVQKSTWKAARVIVLEGNNTLAIDQNPDAEMWTYQLDRKWKQWTIVIENWQTVSALWAQFEWEKPKDWDLVLFTQLTVSRQIPMRVFATK